jgi:hypothetical protein
MFLRTLEHSAKRKTKNLLSWLPWLPISTQSFKQGTLATKMGFCFCQKFLFGKKNGGKNFILPGKRGQG